MIIEHNIIKYIVFHEDTIVYALGKISENESRIIFSVKEDGILEGALSDGDIRRWLTDQEKIDLKIKRTKLLSREQRELDRDLTLKWWASKLDQCFILFAAKISPVKSY